MKAVLFLTLLALAFIYVLSTTEECKDCLDLCPYDCGNNEPTCDSSNVGIKIRNYWEWNLYWICFFPYGEAHLTRCLKDQLFSEEVGECVPKLQYIITCPCDYCGCVNTSTVGPF